MKKILLLILVLITSVSFSQEDAWVYFNDKPNAQFYLDNPLEMLTQRALDRRANQNIALNINDTPVHQPYIDQVIAATGIEVKAKSKWLNSLHVRGSQQDINALLNLPFVNNIEFADDALNAKSNVSNQVSTANKQLDVQVNFAYGNSANQIEMLNGHLLHQQNFTASGKIIAVLDSGFINVNTAQPFQRLFTNNAILGGYNYVSASTDVYSLDGHGTLVLSCMGGFTDGQLVGTAPDAQYYLYVTEDVDTENPVEESFWVEAAEEADRVGVDIITSSLGYFTGFTNPNHNHTYSDMTGNSAFASRGANIAFSKGIVVVASAGNGGATSEPHVGVPAEATNVLAIGAVRADETYVGFSSIGPSFDNRVKPDLMARGQGAAVSNTSGNIAQANGTSFSAPIMAGMIASFWQAVPNLTNQQIVDLVKQSADRFTNPNTQFGYGIPDFQLALNNALLTVNQFNTDSFVLYPNPANAIISIRFPANSSSVNFSLYNNLGQLILEKSNLQSDENLNIENLNSGIYFYKIASANATQTGKIIKK
jgi:hypothetical protein